MRILILTTFPIDKPKHGGQLRVRNLFEKYRSLGYEVLCVGVLGHSSYPLADNFIPYPEDLVNKYEMPYMDDYVLGDICINNSDIYEKLKQKISFVPNAHRPYLGRHQRSDDGCHRRSDQYQIRQV